jgi:hypothetical protein
MRATINRISSSGPKKGGEAFAHILRASHERFANGLDSQIALKAVLRSGGDKYRRLGATIMHVASEVRV